MLLSQNSSPRVVMLVMVLITAAVLPPLSGCSSRSRQEFWPGIELSEVDLGSIALAVHDRPRYTKDMGILIDPTRNNANVLLQCSRILDSTALT